MSWQLDIIEHDGLTPRTTRTHANPTGVWDGFTWRWDRYGNCLTADLRGVVPALGLRNRDFMRLWVQGVRVFYGVVVEAPHPRDPSPGAIKLVGADDLLNRRVIGADVYENMDVGAIARALVQKYRHPGLSFDPALIPDTGKVLSRFSLPWRTLRQALESLGKTIDGQKGVPFGVLPSGAVFFGFQVTSSLPVPYTSAKGLQWLRVNGDEVVTTSYLIAFNRPSGTAPFVTSVYPIGYVNSSDLITVGSGPSTRGATYHPATYTFKATDPDWADVQAEKANVLPDGADIIRAAGQEPLPGPSYYGGLLNPGNAVDGNPATYAENDPALTFHFLQFNQPKGTDADPIVGFRLVYSLDLTGAATPTSAGAVLHYGYPNPAGPTVPPGGGEPILVNATASFDFRLLDTKGELREVTTMHPIPEEFMRDNVTGPFTASSVTPVTAIASVALDMPDTTPLAAGKFRIYTFEPIRLSRAKLDTLARKALVPPAQEPTEFTVAGLLGPNPTVTLTGAPGGDLTADVAEFEGRHERGALVSTVVKLEQPGASETARIMRIVARERAADAQTELRGFLERP